MKSREAKPRKRRRGTAVKAVLGSLLGLSLVVGGATAAYAMHYTDRGLPGVSVVGTPVTGETRADAAHALAQRADEVLVTLTLDGTTTELALADLGVTVDAAATADHAFAANGNLTSQISALFNEQDIPAVISVDEAKARAVVQELAAKAGAPAVDAQVSLSEDGTEYVVSPSQAGKSVDASPLIQTATEAARTLTSRSLELSSSQVAPTVSTGQAQRVADAANALAGLGVSIAGEDYPIEPTDVEQAGWVSLANVSQGVGEPFLDTAKVSEWVHAIAESTNVEPLKGIRNVDENGEVLSVAQEGRDGSRVNNADQVAAELVAALQAGTEYSGQFTYDKVARTYQNRVIAAGTENLAYQAAPGEKWVDVDLSNNTITAYEGSRVVLGPTGMVPGMPGLETPTGKFKVYLKYVTQTMRGTNLDGTTYVAPNIPWVTYFTGSIAFHGAPWRDSFGWSGPGGSHGCVNLPVDAAQFIHGWTEMGTVVVSHY